MQKKLMDNVKKKHTEIMGLEDKYKRIQAAIKVQQDRGYNEKTSKVALQRQATQNENLHFRLTEEVKDLEDWKSQTMN